MSDQDQLVALVDGIEKNLGRKPVETSADAGYCSEATSPRSMPAASKPMWQPDGPSTQPMPSAGSVAS